jgi:hypothetical protein
MVHGYAVFTKGVAVEATPDAAFPSRPGPRRQVFVGGVEEKLLFAAAGPDTVFVKTASALRKSLCVLLFITRSIG